MEIEQYLRILRAHWIAVLLATFVGAVLAYGYASTQPEVYAANSAGFVTTGSGGDPGLENLNDILSKSRAASYIVLATDRETAQIVIDRLHLDTTPSALVGQISAAQPPDTVIIQITATASTPVEAQQLADAWVEALAKRVSDIEHADAAASGSDTTTGMRIETSESAALPTAPVSPNVRRLVAIGAFAGLVLGFAYAIARNVFDRRIRTGTDVERQFQVSVVGTIPDFGKRSDLVVTGSRKDAGGQASEAFRRLRTNIAYMDVDNPPRAIVITSPRQEDGKSTTASNLAAAIALSGQPVTLVDADLRRPSLAPLLGIDGSTGLTDVLSGRVELADAVQQHASIDGLQVLASGGRPPNPSELLGSQAMKTLITTLTRHGLVIIDAPPLLPVTDAAILGHAADGALVTVSTGKTVDHELETALSHLESADARALGIVLNRVSRKNVGARYYGSTYGYGDANYSTGGAHV